MERQLFITEDGSHSVRIPDLNVSYHSKYGAIQESLHIFIGAGLKQAALHSNKIRVLEVGFGTGLNALLTLIEAEKNDLRILYDGVELHPLDTAIVASLNYLSLLRTPHLLTRFSLMHTCGWNTTVNISDRFDINKIYGDISNVELAGGYDLVYFDPFDPASQPELWTVDIFKKIKAVMSGEGVLATYSSKGIVRNRLKDAGFRVMKLEGPKGKREIVRACIQ